MDKEIHTEQPSIREKRFMDHFPSGSDPILIILKGHLLAEEAIDSLISLHCQDDKFYLKSDFSFYSKMRLARSLIGNSFENLYLMLNALNTLRNEIAHKLESKKFDAKAAKFIECVESIRKEKIGSKDSSDLSLAVCYVLGFIDGYERAFLGKAL